MKSQDKKRRKFKIFSTVLLLLNMIAIAALLLSYVSTYVSPREAWIPALFGLAYPYIFFLNLIFVVLWLIGGRKKFLLSLIAIVAGIGQITNYIQFNKTCSALSDSKSIRVISYNIHYLQIYNSGFDITSQGKSLADLLKKESPDVVCLQEFRLTESEFAAKLGKDIGTSYYFASEYYEETTKKNAIITLSRYPIIHQEALRSDAEKIYLLITDIVTDTQDTIRICNTHLESVYFKPEDYTVINEISHVKGKREELQEGSRRILSQLKHAYIERSEEVIHLTALIKRSVYPVVVCGDFNDTPTSYVYRTMTRYTDDSFKKAGSGLGFTYRGSLPFPLRIDYIFTGDYLKACHFKIPRINLSDHYPVMVTVFYE